MIDDFRGQPINQVKEQLEELHKTMHNYFKNGQINATVDVEDLHQIIHVLESMGAKIAELSHEVHEIKNRSVSE